MGRKKSKKSAKLSESSSLFPMRAEEKESSEKKKDLKNAYSSVTGSLIELTIQLRDEPERRLTHPEMIRMFQSFDDWEKLRKASGHVAFKNKITGTVIGFSGHGDPNLEIHEKSAILELLQEHMNILCNEIFNYSTHNWKKEPDYGQSLRNYQHWSENRSKLKDEEEEECSEEKATRFRSSPRK